MLLTTAEAANHRERVTCKAVPLIEVKVKDMFIYT
jgi:hypothetical protein